MWKTFLRPMMIFIPFLLGICFPAAHHLNWLIRWALIFMLYMVCLRLRPRELRPTREHLKLVCANILLGVLPYCILHFLGYETLALAAFFVGITPTANAAPVVMGFLHGRVGFVVTGFVMTNAAIALALVFLLPLVTGNRSLDFVGDVAMTLLFVIGFPAVLALITRIVRPQAQEWPARAQTLSFSFWSLCLFIIAADASNFFRNNPGTSWRILIGIALVSLILCILNFGIGYRLGGHRLGRECSQALGQKNTTLTLFLALNFVNPLVAMGPIFYVLWHNSYNACQMFRFDRRRFLRRGRTVTIVSSEK